MPRVNPFAIALSIILGLVMFGVSINNGEPWLGAGFLIVTWGFAAFLYFGSRISDTIALISDDIQDERHVHIHQKAALYTLYTLAAVIVAVAVVDIARGGAGSPYTWLAAVGGVTYLALLVVFSRRS
jgi:hypothetical protein